MEEYGNEKYKRAKKRVHKIKRFYVHLTFYFFVNAFILLNIYLHADDFWRWENFITLFAWGIGLAFHASKVFGINPLFGKDWEERQIKKYIDEDKREMDKYK